MFMSAEEFPLPYEYRHLPLEDVSHELPPDAEERTIVFLDCGNIDRMPVSFLRRDEAHIVNIDHHHDNTHFGTANLVVGGASCTAEIVYDLTKDLGRRAHAAASPRRCTSALVTDTGQVPVREHDARGASHGGRADRRAAWTSHEVFRAALRERAVRQAPTARAGAGAGRALRRRAAHRLLHQARRLRGDRRRRELLRGHRRPHARASRARSSRRSCASS